jgi:hypothetical protein
MADGSMRMDGRPCGAPDAVWDAARDDYLAGMSGPAVCRRHGLRVGALRARAARDGWRRADQPWVPLTAEPDPFDEGAELAAQVQGDLDRIDYSELVWVCRRRMMRAVLRGEAGAALRWDRVRRMLEAEDAEVDRWIAEQDADAIRRRNAPLGDDRAWPTPRSADRVAAAERALWSDREADSTDDTDSPTPPLASFDD